MNARHLILLCDYDGTLTPIVSHPSLAKLPEHTRTVLAVLARKRRVTAGIVSGRPLNTLRHLVKLKRLAYIGSHGYEVSLPGRKGQLRLSPGFPRRLRSLAQDLRGSLKDLRGPWIRLKTAGVAVHYRQASASTAQEALKRLDGIAKRHSQYFRVQQGKMVFEFLPAGSVTKGTAVRELVRRLHVGRRVIVMYFGDDLTDESVFSNLRKRDFGILVGRPRASRAQYYLRSPHEVARFLSSLEGITK